MKKRDKLVWIVLICMVIMTLSCQKKQTNDSDLTDSLSLAKSKYLFGLVTGTGGLGDKAFNDMQYNGMLYAKKNYGINFIYTAPQSMADDEPAMETLIKKGANVIFAGGGFHMIDPVDHLARKYPQVKFIILDDFAKEYLPNVASVTFKQNEGSFLIGALSAMQTKTKKIGLIAATDINVLQDFITGYKAGAEYIDPSVRVTVKFIGKMDDQTPPFANPKKAYKIATTLYKAENVDIIYQVASASGMGVFNAAKESGSYAMGVDSDQDYLAEGFILTSMMKRLDQGVNMVIDEILKGKFSNKAYKLGLNENGVSLTPMIYTKQLIKPENLQRLKDITEKIKQKNIIVPSVYKD